MGAMNVLHCCHDGRSASILPQCFANVVVMHASSCDSEKTGLKYKLPRSRSLRVPRALRGQKPVFGLHRDPRTGTTIN